MAITPQTELEANHPDTILRELSWVAKTDPLWTTGDTGLYRRLRGHFPDALSAIAETVALDWAWHGAPARLGRRFEALFTALLDATPEVSVLTHGLPIRDNLQTVGELDYVIAFEGQVIHLEIAIKFYAGLSDPVARKQPSGWVGPSCQDRLDLKMDHLVNHQLPLAEHPLTRSVFREMGLPLVTQSIGLIFGHLISPWSQPPVWPERLSETGRSFWCTHREAEDAFRTLSRPYGSTHGWAYVPRSTWIAPYQGVVTLPQAPQRLPMPEQADCYALCRKDVDPVERLRVFVMPNDFPARALEASQN